MSTVNKDPLSFLNRQLTSALKANDQLKRELEVAQKEIFKLKHALYQLHKKLGNVLE